MTRGATRGRGRESKKSGGSSPRPAASRWSGTRSITKWSANAAHRGRPAKSWSHSPDGEEESRIVAVRSGNGRALAERTATIQRSQPVRPGIIAGVEDNSPLACRTLADLHLWCPHVRNTCQRILLRTLDISRRDRRVGRGLRRLADPRREGGPAGP